MRVVGATLLALGSSGALSHTAPCFDVALVLAVDASSSIDEVEFEYQKAGIAAAFRSEGVNDALAGAGLVAVATVFWGDPKFPTYSSGWVVIASRRDSEIYAAGVEATARHTFGSTGISTGLSASLDLLEQPGFCSARKIIDVSGDGRETIMPKRRALPTLEDARRRAREAGVTVNALVIVDEEPDVGRFYRERVTAGTGSFVMEVRHVADYGGAMQTKMIRELAPIAIAAIGGE